MAEDNSKDIERAQKKQDAMLQEQIDMQNADLESKRQEVFQQRKRILDTQRGPSWSTDYKPAVVPSIQKPKESSNLIENIIVGGTLKSIAYLDKNKTQSKVLSKPVYNKGI